MKTFWIGTLLIFLNTFISSADTIKISADPWMPFTGIANSKAEGFMIDIAREAFKLEGYKLEYINETWIRSIANAKRDVIHGIAGTDKREVPKFIFGKEALGMTINNFYTLKSSTWTFESVDSLENQTLGVVRAYSYGNIIDNYIKKYEANSNHIQFVSSEEVLDDLFKKLLHRRISCLVDQGQVLDYYLKENPEAAKQVRFAGIEGFYEPIYIAFSPKNPKSQDYADALDSGIQKLRKSGRLKEILKKYGLKDWQTALAK